MSDDRVWLASRDGRSDSSPVVDHTALLLIVGALLGLLATPFIAIKNVFRRIFH